MAIDKSNPSTRRLVNYWVKGEGAAKVRWGTDGAHVRCERALAGKVRDPGGLCAELHKEATGEWPAEKGVESSMDAETFEMLAGEVIADLDGVQFAEDLVSNLRAVQDRVISWEGMVAPADKPTGDGRQFAAGALDHRELPLPAMFQVATGSGHANAVTVASIDAFEERADGWYARGEFLDPRIVPEATRAIYLIQKKLARPSVDLEPDLTYEMISEPDSDPRIRITRGRLAGTTFVAKPAFADLKITVHDSDVQALLASAGIEAEFVELTVDPEPAAEFTVNATSWAKMPLGERDQPFDADDAIARLIEASGGNAATFSKAFLWKQTDGDPNNKASYRLPIADVINGKMTLVPHAVYAAAAILSGAHGGLPQVPENEKEGIRKILTEIYDILRDTYSDPRIMPPWQRGGRRGADGTGDAGVQKNQASLTANEIALGVTEPEDVITAATAAGFRPPAAWFRNPDLTAPTGLRVTEEGRIYGHLASWNVCHTGIGNKCVTAPHSVTDYRYFKVGTVVTSDGKELAVGKITLGGGHADPQYGIRPALEHYDNAGAAVAAVSVGEDGHGVWVAGALLPGVDDARIAQLRLSPLSGDWRRVDGNLELIAALAVNTPGFPVIRASAAGEEEETLLAAGVVELPKVNLAPSVTVKLAEIDTYLMDQAKVDRLARIKRIMGS